MDLIPANFFFLVKQWSYFKCARRKNRLVCYNNVVTDTRTSSYNGGLLFNVVIAALHSCSGQILLLRSTTKGYSSNNA